MEIKIVLSWSLANLAFCSTSRIHDGKYYVCLDHQQSKMPTRTRIVDLSTQAFSTRVNSTQIAIKIYCVSKTTGNLTQATFAASQYLNERKMDRVAAGDTGLEISMTETDAAALSAFEQAARSRRCIIDDRLRYDFDALAETMRHFKGSGTLLRLWSLADYQIAFRHWDG